MKKAWLVLLSLAVAMVMVGCDDDDDDDDGGGGVPGSVAGAWSGTGNYVHNNVPITSFNLNLAQDGDNVSGSYSIKRDARDTMNGSVSGTASGGNIDLTMNPHGQADGTCSGNSMTLDWYESGFGGADWTGPRNGTVNLSR
ncbi:MAG: hypothetical protein JXB04_10230 [Kiritimatiellae bacterium]|nr:hypothetical protein [Kiritimatiellia bacterium]